MSELRIGLMLPVAEDDDGSIRSWPQLRELGQRAEAVGLDSLWLADHLLYRSPDRPTRGIHEAWTMLTALAACTERVTIGPLVLALPFRNPALLAKMAAALDEVSDGRLILGIGCGWNEPEFTAFNYPFDRRVARFEEGLQILLPLLRNGRTDFEGRWHAAPDCELRPPARPGGPPVLIAGNKPRMMRLVARHADVWNTAWFGAAEEIDERISRLREALDAEGRDPASLELTAGVIVEFPHLADEGSDRPPRAISGDIEAVARGLAAFRERNVRHLIVSLADSNVANVEELGRAAARAWQLTAR
jgi:probable F420-dependent oxidoreductase